MRYLRYLFLLVLIGTAAAKLYPHFRDFSKIYELKNSINYFYLTLGILSQSFQYLGDGWMSQTLLKIIGIEMKFKNAVKIASLNVLAAHLFPVGEVGSVSAAYYFYKKLGVPTQSFIFLTVCWTAITAATIFAIFVVSMFFIPHLPYLNFKLLGTIILTVVVSATAAIVIARKFIWHKIREKFQNNALVKELIQFKEDLHIYRQSIHKHKYLVIQSIIGAFIYYGANIATLCFSFLTFGLTPHIPLVAFAYAISLWSGVITLSPAGLGAAEASMLLIFLEYGIDPVKSIGVVLAFRLISFWIPIPAGAISYFSLKKHDHSIH